MKVEARNNLLRKLSGYEWGACPHTLRTTALALCYSAAEYASPVWFNSKHAAYVDKARNETCRLVTGCLKPTNVDKVRVLAGIAPPSVRREIVARAERTKAETDSRHALFSYVPPQRRLKSRSSFMAASKTISVCPSKDRLELWTRAVPDIFPPDLLPIKEELPPGADLNFHAFKSINRMRCMMGRSKANLCKWGYSEDDKCDCGNIQTMEHLLLCPNNEFLCNFDDVLLANDNAQKLVLKYRI